MQNSKSTAFLKHFCVFFAVIFCVTLVDFFYLEKPLTGIDDGNIFLNYAHHFSKGEGFVYNTNGERVEGFTSMLWVLICAAFFCVSAHPEIMLIVLCLLLTTLTVTFVYMEASKDVKRVNLSFYKKNFLWIYTAFIICIGPIFLAWSVLSLMENALWNFLFTSLVIILLQYSEINISLLKKNLACLIGILLTITRPESYAWNLLFFIVFTFIALKNKRGFLFPLAYLFFSIAAAVTLIVFRIHYFGYPLPNTYYAKVSPDKLYNIKEGLIYAINFFTDFHPIATLFIVVLFITSLIIILNFRKTLHNDHEKIRVSIISLIVFAALCLPLTTGGDHFGGFRFYQEVLLLSVWAIPAAVILYNETTINKLKSAILSWRIIVMVFFLLIGSGILYNLKHPSQAQLNFEFDIAKSQRVLAEEMNSYWRGSMQPPSVGVLFAGSFALEYHGTTIDLMGLNNTLMGHSSGNRIGIKNHAAFNKDVFYKLNPDVIFPEVILSEKEAHNKYIQLLSDEDFLNEAVKNIFNDSYFQQNYYPVIITNASTGTKIFLFSNKHFFQKLQTNNLLQVKKI